MGGSPRKKETEKGVEGMGPDFEQRTCTAAIGSVTQAMHARRLLAEAAVYATVVKNDPEQTGRGCAWGISYPCSMERSVREVLRKNGVRAHFGRGPE